MITDRRKCSSFFRTLTRSQLAVSSEKSAPPSFGIPSGPLINNWVYPERNSFCPHGIYPGSIICNRIRRGSLCSCSLFSCRISAPVSSRFLVSTFTRQSDGFESHNLITQMMVCQHTNPFFCVSRKSYRNTALCVTSHSNFNGLFLDSFGLHRSVSDDIAVGSSAVVLLECAFTCNDLLDKWTCNETMYPRCNQTISQK